MIYDLICIKCHHYRGAHVFSDDNLRGLHGCVEWIGPYLTIRCGCEFSMFTADLPKGETLEENLKSFPDAKVMEKLIG
jgi:hypothetical protein